jgi:hypothetical protein
VALIDSQDAVVARKKVPAVSQNAFVHTLYGDKKVKVKSSRYRPGVAQRVP